MNPRLELLEPYPFERMAALKQPLRGNPAFEHIALSIGEPKHAPPDFVIQRLADRAALTQELAAYPATRGTENLRTAISGWLARRFGAATDPETQVLPVAGTREALFSFPQALLSGSAESLVVMPNPFYQIYEGAAYLGGATPFFVNCTPDNDYLPDFDAVPEAIWRRTELLILCSPGNPTGRVLPLPELTRLIELAHRFDFVIAADECYSEIYRDEHAPPPGLLEASARMGNPGHARCVVFHSLSKRSNLPGLRSGFVAGDAELLAGYFQYRTYHGCALGLHIQAASALAWADETHVIANRAAYRQKFDAIVPQVQQLLPDYRPPEGGFYCWLPTPDDDVAFTARLFEQEHITVLPGTFLSRDTGHGNPGRGHVRVAWVAPLADCLNAAERLLPHLAGSATG